MKKMMKILAVVTMLVVCYAANASNVSTNSNVNNAVESSVVDSDYEYVQTVAIIKISGHAKIKNSAKLYTKNNTLYISPLHSWSHLYCTTEGGCPLQI